MKTATLERQEALWRLKGVVTVSTVGALSSEVQTALVTVTDTAEVTLDCSEIEAADSSAIALMVEMSGQLKRQGKVLRVTGLKTYTENLIHLYGVEWILDAGRSASDVTEAG